MNLRMKFTIMQKLGTAIGVKFVPSLVNILFPLLERIRRESDLDPLVC